MLSRSKSKIYFSIICGCLFLTSCTVSFQNINTTDGSSDTVEDKLTNSPDITPEFEIPPI